MNEIINLHLTIPEISMNHSTHTWGKSRAIAGLIAGVILTFTQTALAQNPTPGSLPPQTYGAWGAKWWQWAFSLPATDNPTVTTGDIDCTAGQQGHVYFFLAGFFSLVADPHVGEHTIRIFGKFGPDSPLFGYQTDVIYYLTVGN